MSRLFMVTCKGWQTRAFTCDTAVTQARRRQWSGPHVELLLVSWSHFMSVTREGGMEINQSIHPLFVRAG